VPDEKQGNCCFQPECTFFSGDGETASDRVLKQIFCAHPHLAQGCAIYLRRRSSKAVPENLCPNGDVRLREEDPGDSRPATRRPR
jgi:hypothetical protein